MKEKKYMIEAWEIAYEAINNNRDYLLHTWTDEGRIEITYDDLDEDDKLKYDCYTAIMEKIEKIA